jgi:hypothetical protein
MILSDYQLRFKKFGKFINLSYVSGPPVVTLKTAHAATVDQTSQTDQTVEFDVNDQIVTTLGSTVKSVAAQVQTIPAAAFTAADGFLKKFVAIKDLGLTGTPTNAQVGTALVASMTSAGATVAASGTNGANASGFAMFFANNWGIVLPQSGSPSIPDSYITATVL